MEDDRDRSPRSDLVDLTGLDLDALASMPETVFTAALRRLVDERDRPGEDYCRFNSVIDVAVRPSGGSAGDSARTTR